MVLVIRTKGSSYERGLQQGSILRKRVQLALNVLFNSKMFKDVTPKGVPLSLVKVGLGKMGKRNIKRHLIKYFPHHAEKLKGISKGCGIIVSLNYGLHLLEVIAGDPKSTYANPPTQACTMLMALPEATKDGELIYARNYDFPKVLQPYQVVRIEEPDDGRYKNITLTQYPLVGAHIAYNEKGLVIGYNYGRAWKQNPLDFRMEGIPGTILVQEAIETCANVQEVIDFITKFPARSNGVFYGVVDKEGNACVIETTSTRHSIRYPKDGVLAHTNLYLTDELKDANLPDNVRFKLTGLEISPKESPKRRLKRATELLEKYKGKITTKTLKMILRDHDNGDPNSEGPDDFSICTHGETGITLASMVILPRKGEFWVVDNQPCKEPYEKITFDTPQNI
ncbi:MAG: C45 family autoproteolytic acyltransferase/hydrolase [Promethearchaeota archaeon]